MNDFSLFCLDHSFATAAWRRSRKNGRNKTN